jgi:hypothetical protein
MSNIKYLFPEMTQKNQKPGLSTRPSKIAKEEKEIHDKNKG